MSFCCDHYGNRRLLREIGANGDIDLDELSGEEERFCAHGRARRTVISEAWENLMEVGRHACDVIHDDDSYTHVRRKILQ